MSSFLEIGISEHLGKENQLVKLNKLLNWKIFTNHLKNVHKEAGPTGYDPLKMFKALLLGQWHNLSDSALEETLRVRLDFIQFTGFSLGDNLPDSTTFCRFRNKLASQKKVDLLFNEVITQLEAHGIKVFAASTAIVDATIISSNARPNKVMEEWSENNYHIEYSADPDARWLKKGRKSYFGYRAYARCDAEGFIDKTHVTPANLPETKELEHMASGLKKGTRILADKGFFSKMNKEILKSMKLKNGLMYKAFRNSPLTKKMKQFNKLISKTRFRIEQCFGTIKRRFSYQKASYFTTEKVDAQFKMKAICLNLLKAINKVEFA
jgi:IS5 family transposase